MAKIKEIGYTPAQIKELEKINQLPSKGKNAYIVAFAKKHNKTTAAVYAKLTYMLNGGRLKKTKTGKRGYTRRASMVATVMPKTEPVISGRTVEIKGITSISFSNGTLTFKF